MHPYVPCCTLLVVTPSCHRHAEQPPLPADVPAVGSRADAQVPLHHPLRARRSRGEGWVGWLAGWVVLLLLVNLAVAPSLLHPGNWATQPRDLDKRSAHALLPLVVLRPCVAQCSSNEPLVRFPTPTLACCTPQRSTRSTGEARSSCGRVCVWGGGREGLVGGRYRSQG